MKEKMRYNNAVNCRGSELLHGAAEIKQGGKYNGYQH